MSNWQKKISVFFFLILFAGYYGSIIFFYHAHLINGDSIIHSHPSRTDPGGIPEHSHSSSGYLTIQILSGLIFTLVIQNFCLKVSPSIVLEITSKTRQGCTNQAFCFQNHLRAPPQIL